mgnify:CR=1 FL=1
MKTIEYNHGNNWLDKLLNSWPLCLDVESIIPLIRGGICKNENIWHMWASRDAGTSLYYNGLVFFRLMFPFWIGIHIRFGKRFLQTGIGWKLNGRFALLFRIQTDESSAEGTHGPNYGQSVSYDCGTK